MDIISCDTCAVVLDAHKLKFPDPDGNMEGDEMFPPDQYVWSCGRFVPITQCPSCGGTIQLNGGE